MNKRKPINRWIALLLALAMIFSSQAMEVLADTSSYVVVDDPTGTKKITSTDDTEVMVTFYKVNPDEVEEDKAQTNEIWKTTVSSTTTYEEVIKQFNDEPGNAEYANNTDIVWSIPEGEADTAIGRMNEENIDGEDTSGGDTSSESTGSGDTNSEGSGSGSGEGTNGENTGGETSDGSEDADGGSTGNENAESEHIALWICPFTVTFYEKDPDEIETEDPDAEETNLLGEISEAAYGSYLSEIIEQFAETNPDYADVEWNLGGDYIITHNVSVWKADEDKVALVEANDGKKTFATLQDAIDAIGYSYKSKDDKDYTEEYSINGEQIPNDGTAKITLLKDVKENVTASSKYFELDMKGHTVTAADASKRAFSIINSNGAVTLKNGVITGTTNSGFDEVYGLYVNGNVSSAHGSFTGENLRIVGNKSGILFRYGETVTLTNVSVESSTSDGGIIIADGVHLTANNLVVQNNTNVGTTSDRYNGGGIYVRTSGNTLVLNNSTIAGNTAGGSSGGFSYPRDGGGIYLTAGSSLELNNCTVSGNTAKKAGGGIYANGTVNINGGIIGNNTGVQGGGGIYAASKAAVQLNAVQITGNAVTNTKYTGGGLYSLGSLTFNSLCSVNNNSAASVSGVGGIYVGGTITTDGSELILNGNNNYSLYFGGSSAVALSNLTITGNKAGSVIGSKLNQALTLTDCRFTDNTLSSNYCTFSATGSGNITFNGCRFERNGAPYVSYEFSSSAGTATFENCQIRDNTGQYSYGIKVGAKASVIVRNSVITGHTKHGVEMNGSFTMEGGAIYGNEVGDILVATTGVSMSVPAANAMTDAERAEQDFAEYVWNEKYEMSDETGDKDEDLAAGTGITLSSADMAGKKDHIYTATLPSDKAVAQLEKAGSTDEPEKYKTVKEAIEAAKDFPGSTVKLIRREAKNGKTRIYETVTIPSGTEVTLDLNGHELYATDGPFVVEAGANLTLTDSAPSSSSKAPGGYIYRKSDYKNGEYALVNHGTLTVVPGGTTKYWPPKIYSIDFSDGVALTLPVSLQITQAIRLGKDKQISLTSAKSQSKSDAPVIVLADEVIKNLNDGTGEEANGVVIYQAIENVSINSTFLSYTEARLRAAGVSSAVEVASEKDDSGMARIIARPRVLEGIYLNGSSGNDETGTGKKDGPVKTFEKAKEMLEDQIKMYESQPEGHTKPQGIYVSGAVKISSDETWELPAGTKLIRAANYTGELINITSGALTLQNITIDGYGKEGTKAKEALIKITAAKGTLNIEGGAVLTNNYHTTASSSGYTYAGGAVYCKGGTVNVNGGTVTQNAALYGGGIEMYGGSLSMSSGTISNNSAVIVGSYDAAGGGVCLLLGASFDLSGGSISNNSTAGVGGGIAVGGHIANTMNGKEVLNMTGAQVNNNSAIGCGGGIFVQCRTKAYVYGGTISGNEAAIGKSPMISSNGLFMEYGGGGIYVNGERSGYAEGELYLKNVLVTGNSSAEGGNGFAGCGTSTTKIYLTEGGAIYNNNGNYSQVLIANDGISHISDVMLGGGLYNWTYSDGSKVPFGKLQYMTNAQTLNLGNSPSKEPSWKAVTISGNTSGTRGGGIGSNGFVQIGTDSASAVIPVKKAVTGISPDEAVLEGYQFVLKDASGSIIQRATSDKNGDAQFILEYTAPDTYEYTMEEVKDNPVPGITYDDSIYHVTVTVNNEWVTSVSIRNDLGDIPEAVFTNTYDASGALTLPAKKVLEDKELEAETFHFVLTETDEKGNILTGDAAYSQEATNDAEGNISFAEIPFTLVEDAGEMHYYTVYEVKGDDASITYDETVYTVTVGPIADNGNGSLGDGSGNDIPYKITDSNGNVLGPNDTMTFTNQYHASGNLTLDATKILNGAELTAGQFSFTLTATDADGNALTGDGAYSETVTNAADGNITFKPFHYTQEDKDKDYYYTVTEVQGTDERVTYDGTVYRVAVHVTDNGDGTMTAAKTITANGEAAEAITFTNTYQSEADGSLALDATKILNGAALAAGQFSFTLTATDADGNALTGENAYSETVVNAADGSVSFTPLAYTEEDDGKDYYYTVTEVRGTDAQVTYDGTVYRVAVHVTDNKDGTLTIEKTVTAGGQPAGDMIFTNTYTQQEEDRLTVVKQLTYNDTIYSAADATYYVALYADEALTQRVSDIMPLVYRNSGTASVEFTGLERGGTYYVGETTADGTVINNIGGVTADGTQYSPYFANGTRVVISEDGTSVFYFENVFLELPPEQFYPEGELTVTKQLTYAGEDYGAIDATYYVALFSDEALTDRVSEIMPLVYRNAGSTSVKFGGLEIGKTYYIGETTADGTVLNSIGGVTADGVEYSALFAGGNSAVVNEEGTAAVAFENEFEELPKDYYREGELTITKRLLGADGSAKNSSETFYAGIFADEAHTTLSDQVSQNIVPLNLGGKSFAEAKIKVAIAPGATQTLYVTEVDQNGKPVAGAASFRYDVTVENAVIQMDENVTEGAVIITNKETSPDDSETPETVTTTSVKTGDETPIVPYLIALAAAALALVILFVIRRRRRAK